MIKSKWNSSIIIRYALFQVPAFLIVISIIFLLDEYYNLTYVLISTLLVLWIVKDMIMYRFVWKAYDVDNKGHINRLIGCKGIVIEDLNPIGYVNINGELWQAEEINGKVFLPKDEIVEVIKIDGLKIHVRKTNDLII